MVKTKKTTKKQQPLNWLDWLAGRQQAGGEGGRLWSALPVSAVIKVLKSASLNYFGRAGRRGGAEGAEGAHVEAASDSLPEHLCVTAANKGVITTTCLLTDLRDASSDTDRERCSRAEGTA